MSEDGGSPYKMDLIREMSLKIRNSPKAPGRESPGFLRPSPKNSPKKIMNSYEEVQGPVPTCENIVEDPDKDQGDLLQSIQEEIKSPGLGKTPELEDPSVSVSVA